MRGKLNLFVHNRQMYLVLNVHATTCQFIEKTRTNGTFEHAGTECRVYGQRALDYSVTRFIRTHERPTLRVLCVHRGEAAPKQVRDHT